MIIHPMTEFNRNILLLSPEQRAIWDRCFHPSRTFVEFTEADVESSIAARFEQIVARHEDRLAVQSADCSMTYGELNRLSNRVAASIIKTLGETPEPVGVLCRHDGAVVAAILGILKAGKFICRWIPVGRGKELPRYWKARKPAFSSPTAFMRPSRLRWQARLHGC